MENEVLPVEEVAVEETIIETPEPIEPVAETLEVTE